MLNFHFSYIIHYIFDDLKAKYVPLLKQDLIQIKQNLYSASTE